MVSLFEGAGEGSSIDLLSISRKISVVCESEMETIDHKRRCAMRCRERGGGWG